MSGGRLERWSPVAGIAFVALFLLSTAVLANGIPGADDSDETIVSYYADSGNQFQAEVAYFSLTLGAVLFLWFAGTLSASVRRLERDYGWLSRITVASGTAFAAVLIVGSALAAMVPDVSNDSENFGIDPDTVRLLTDASYTLVFETALPLAAPLVFAVSLPSCRRARSPAGSAGRGSLLRFPAWWVSSASRWVSSCSGRSSSACTSFGASRSRPLP